MGWLKKYVPDCLVGLGFSPSNPAASMLWHQLTVLEPPGAIMKEKQKTLLIYFGETFTGSNP